MAQIKNGTVSVTNGSNTVTGSGTTWLTDGVQAGDGFVLQTSSGVTGSGVYYTVAGVASNTSLTLTANWGGATASGAAYIVHTDFIAAGYPAFLPGDLEVKPVMNRNVLKLVNDKADSADLGTAAAADLTTSSTDTTAGRVLQTGAGIEQAYRAGNILGTVSQSGGVPTGAIIERGSNADGEYVKFADGTLICARHLTGTTNVSENNIFGSTSGTIYRKTFSDLNFPVSFVANPEVAGTGSHSGETTSNRDVAIFSVGTSTYGISLRANTDGAPVVGGIIAIGRWY